MPNGIEDGKDGLRASKLKFKQGIVTSHHGRLHPRIKLQLSPWFRRLRGTNMSQNRMRIQHPLYQNFQFTAACLLPENPRRNDASVVENKQIAGIE